MLTQDERKLVEDNHNLIYWYAHLCGLDIEEWYGLLAIELCHTVQKYSPERGALSTYFKLRCDCLVIREFRRKNSKKRFHFTTSYSPVIHDNIGVDDTHYNVVDVLNDPDYGELIRMRYDGYTQQEMALEFGISQSHVSKILQKVKTRYYENN